MNMLTKEDYQEVRGFVYRNARPLDWALWRYRLEGGRAEDVLEALSAYQNADGGFGHGIDPDNWNPNSTPYNATQAIGIFRELSIFGAKHPMVAPMLAYLGETPFFDLDVGWHFSIPSNDEYPHAPWWSYSEENNRSNGFHATGTIASYILRCADASSPAHRRALESSGAIARRILAGEVRDVHEVGAYRAWLDGVRDAQPDGAFDVPALARIVRRMVDGAIERDPANWPRYSMRPSTYISSPDSPYYPGNEAVMELELNFILETRRAGGVWDISWQWADYPREFAISENYWKCGLAGGNVALLKAFGRVE